MHFFSFHQLGLGKGSLALVMVVSLRVYIRKISNHSQSGGPFSAFVDQTASVLGI